MKKGFTLIELLAVIIILGVIAVIVIPSLNSVIKKAKINSFIASVEGLVKTAEIKIGEDRMDGIKTDTIELSELTYKGKVYIDGQIILNKNKDVSISVWDSKLKVCAIKNYTDSTPIISPTIKNKEACRVDRGEGNICAGELWTNIDFGDTIDAYLDGTTLCLFGNPVTSTPVVLPESWAPLAIEVTDFILEEFDSEFFDDEEAVFVFAYVAYFHPAEWQKVLNRYNIFLQQIWDDVSDGVISMSNVLNNNADFAQFVNSIPYANPNTAGEIRNFEPEENALKLTGITNIIFSGEITRIGDFAFGITDVSGGTPVGYNESKSNQTFDVDNLIFKDKKTKIKPLISGGPGVDPGQIESITFGTSLQEIGKGAFVYNSIEQLVLPNSVTKIGKGAFASNMIASLTLPSNLKSIGDYAFAGSHISNLILPSGLVRIGDGAFSENQISSLTIPDGVIYLSGFDDNLLTSINIPNSVEIIGENAFEYNNISQEFVFPSNIKVIDEDAFYGNPIFGTLNIPSTLEYIDEGAFSDTNIEIINISNTAIHIDPWAFDDNTGLTTINADFNYQGLFGYPWGSTATINWLRAVTYTLTYNSGVITPSASCFNGTGYYGECVVSLTAVGGNNSVSSYKVNGVTYTTSSFTMPTQNSVITDVVVISSYILQTVHPYSNNMNQTFTATIPGATKIKVTFNSLIQFESCCDWIYLTDSNNFQVGGQLRFGSAALINREFIVDGNTINIRFTSDGSVTGYGFFASVSLYE